MSPILSTRILSEEQKKPLEVAQIAVEEYNAITIDLLDFTLPEGFTHFIFTSKNGVKSFLQHLTDHPGFNISEIRCFCVGRKTRSFLKENGLKVIKMADNALELAHFIQNIHKNQHFLIFTGNRNRPELRNILQKENILFEEVEVYQTSLVFRQFNSEFQAILFYSPSGVESFTQVNEIGETPVFCIGETTAKEARKHSNHVHVSENNTVDGVIQALIRSYPTPLKH